MLAILAGIAALKFLVVPENDEQAAKEEASRPLQDNPDAREVEPAVSALQACQAKCRDDYGGSGSPGFDACIRACGAGGHEREQACPSPSPACPSPQSPICNDGRWYCRENPSGAAGARVFPETNNVELNYPTEAQLREGACGEPAMACPSPEFPECRNGLWVCIGPAKGAD